MESFDPIKGEHRQTHAHLNEWTQKPSAILNNIHRLILHIVISLWSVFQEFRIGSLIRTIEKKLLSPFIMKWCECTACVSVSHSHMYLSTSTFTHNYIKLLSPVSEVVVSVVVQTHAFVSCAIERDPTLKKQEVLSFIQWVVYTLYTHTLSKQNTVI